MLTFAAVLLKLFIAVVLLPFKLVAALASGVFYFSIAVAALVVVVITAAVLPVLLPLAAVAAIAAAILA